jgi:hypothetical protein
MISGPTPSDSAGVFFRRPIFSAWQFLVLDLGLDPAPNGGAVGIGRLGLLSGGAGGGAGGGGAPLAHGLSSQRGLRKWS